jgi:hypothetical protein
MQSIAKKLGSLPHFPDFQNVGVYMHKTHMASISLPLALKRYEPVIDHMLALVKDRQAVCYVTIDEKVVSGTSHRRGGVHVDHNWYEDIKAHGGTGGHGYGGHNPTYNPAPQWNVGGNGGSWKKPEPERGGSHQYTGTHNANMDEFNGGMLLTSNYPACKVWNGEFQGVIGEGGCCKDILLDSLTAEIMPANDVYYLNPLGIHESLPIQETVARKLVRINFHPDYLLV